MRRFERIISLVAVVGVLLHAGLLVRHNGIMLGAAFDRLALSFAGDVICHGGADNAQTDLPSQSGKLPNCPICMGGAAAAAILPPVVVLPGMGLASSPKRTGVDPFIGQRSSDIRPPSRAPPVAV